MGYVLTGILVVIAAVAVLVWRTIGDARAVAHGEKPEAAGPTGTGIAGGDYSGIAAGVDGGSTGSGGGAAGGDGSGAGLS